MLLLVVMWWLLCVVVSHSAHRTRNAQSRWSPAPAQSDLCCRTLVGAIRPPLPVPHEEIVLRPLRSSLPARPSHACPAFGPLWRSAAPSPTLVAALVCHRCRASWPMTEEDPPSFQAEPAQLRYPGDVLSPWPVAAEDPPSSQAAPAQPCPHGDAVPLQRQLWQAHWYDTGVGAWWRGPNKFATLPLAPS